MLHELHNLIDSLKEYSHQKEIDEIVWRSIPNTLAFWSWLSITVYRWQYMATELDNSAAIGLGGKRFNLGSLEAFVSSDWNKHNSSNLAVSDSFLGSSHFYCNCNGFI